MNEMPLQRCMIWSPSNEETASLIPCFRRRSVNICCKSDRSTLLRQSQPLPVHWDLFMVDILQGDLAHKKQPTSLGPP